MTILYRLPSPARCEIMTKLFHLYSRRRCFHQNLNLTKETPETWSSQFEILGTLPKPNIFASLLSRCTRSFSFSSGLQVHAHVVKSGLLSDRDVGNSLLSLYFKLCPDIHLTRKVFDGLLYKDSVSWTSMVSGYVRFRKPEESLRVFNEMLSDCDVNPNEFILSAVIKACSDCKDLILGRCFHSVVLLRGFGWNHVVSCTLIDMYGRNHLPNDAVKVFEEMQFPDDVCWTAIISTLTRNDRFQEALTFFYAGIHRKCCPGMVPDMFTFGSVLMALGNLRRTRQGRQVHAMVFTSGIIGNVVVESSLVDMYAKCGLIPESRSVFDRMPNKNAVSWCSLLNGYCQNGYYEVVLKMFRDMDEQDDGYSLSTILRACAGLSDVRRGKQVHCHFLRKECCSEDVVIKSALVDLYAKCGLVDYAYRIFTEMKSKNLITWNAMICGFAKNSRPLETIQVLEKMLHKKQAIKPDHISFTGVLFACSHSGLVEEGKKYFTSMIKDYRIQPQIEHYNCMVDLLGRAELFEEAEELIMRSPCRNDPRLWVSLLGACACTTSYSNPSFAESVAKKVIDLNPDYHLSYVLLANIYRSSHRWDDAVNIRRLMKERGLRKSSGCSWIGVKTNSQITQIH